MRPERSRFFNKPYAPDKMIGALRSLVALTIFKVTPGYAMLTAGEVLPAGGLMLTVHHLGKSQSERIVWLCEELELPYELKRYTRDPVTMLAPAEYKALHRI